MGLSNTAIPRYYGIFRDRVLRGEIPINHEIELEMNRIDNLIRDPRYYYDDLAVDGYVDYCNNELTLTDGSPLELLDTFKLWAEQIFGWYYFSFRDVYESNPNGHGGRYVRKRVKKRLTKKQFLIIARGAAKSMYASTIQSYYLNVDGSTTSQIAIGPTIRQADEVMSPIRTSIVRARGPLFKMLTMGSIQNTSGSRAFRPKLFSSKKGVENHLTGSLLEVRPMSIDKVQGLKPKCATVDEWLSGDIREDVIGALEQGCSKMQNDDYIILATSSEGTVRNSSGDTIKMELMQILRGEYYAPHVSIWYYRLDDVKEVADKSTWLKANPNLGMTISYEAYELDVERAEKIPAARNDILAKRFGIPLEGFTYFFTYEETLPHRPQVFWRMACAVGMDASQGDDFWAFAFLFPIDGIRFGVKAMCYVTERTMAGLATAMRLKYDEFLAEGSLRVMPGAMLDPMGVYDDIDQFIDQQEYDVRAFGFDPYNAKGFMERWEMENGPYGIEKVAQGARTETVPLGEIKHMAEDRNLIFDQKIVSFTMGNAITIEDTNGNRKLYKKRADAKIDVVAAMMDALVAFKAHMDAFE